MAEALRSCHHFVCLLFYNISGNIVLEGGISFLKYLHHLWHGSDAHIFYPVVDGCDLWCTASGEYGIVVSGHLKILGNSKVLFQCVFYSGLWRVRHLQQGQQSKKCRLHRVVPRWNMLCAGCRVRKTPVFLGKCPVPCSEQESRKPLTFFCPL